MKSYIVSFVVLLLVISYNVILSNKNDTFHSVDKFMSYRDNEESLEQSELKADAATKVEDSLDSVSTTTTFRPSRLNNSSNSPHQRDTKLMNLLAARRSALHQDRFRTHSRSATTGRTKPSTEATSKAPPDARTVCVRNCTKNFTRRTSASCMRQCTNIHRRNNSTNSSSSSSSTNNNNSSSEEEKSQKDNNEILFTDESSHGFFVVAKDANDTMNHIPELRKFPGVLPGNLYKGRPRNKPNVSVQQPDTDSESYLYFGRKIPSLRPSFLSISTVSDEHPQVFEVSVSQKPPRPKSSNKFNPRDRLSSPFTRKLNVGKLATLVSPDPIPIAEHTTTLKPDAKKSKPSEKQNVSAEVQSEPEVPSLKLIVDTPLPREINLRFDDSSPTPVEKSSTTTTIHPPEVSTPLIINVIDEEETTTVQTTDPEYATNPTDLGIEDASTEIAKVEAPAHFSEDKTNLIIFVNKSMKTVTPSPPPLVQTTIFSSVRSTVYPPTASVPSKAPDSVSTEKHKDRENIFAAGEEENVDITSPSYESPEITIRALTEATDETKTSLAKDGDLSRLNIATYTLAALGMIPVLIGVVYLARSLILRGYSKHDEDFDVCITDQKPISPVKKIDNNYEDDEEESGQYEQCSISSRDEFNRANLRLKSLLGEGNFGKVWKAEADDLSGHIGATRIVAVKTVRSGSSQNDLREEATIMRKLGSHPNIVTLLGACLESEPQMLIMEFAMRGRLLSLLRAARSATNILPASVPGGKSLAPLSPRTLAGFSLDIAAGMEYIADKRIVHRDLAARNILIDHNGVCKICDFGMSTDLDVIQKNDKHYDVKTIRTTSKKLDKFKFDLGERFINNWSHGFSANTNTKKTQDTLGRRPALPIRWMAPEALQYNEFSIETDVWAFGIVLWEIATLGATPYSNLSGREVVRHVLQGTRPELPKDGRHGFFDLMLQCWHKVPSMRPTFHEARLEISRSVCKWLDEDAATSDYMDVSGFSEDLEHGMVYFNQRISEFECDI
ncbi:uncharacterized protein LOC129946026 [Eupeodes corollae]|uniref:uncharacterized protein LOC129946026 n=1 Tax=Eupeodes corollae TaxID=290404 RepID=UPI0024908C1B|nr:uncharacterized protein LOC129946026 [Eupeodes corollae]XP_055912013.1 uncharacterized protein LOC129946026 [Eupeodes corollae]